jgi:hypothetical protein
MIDLIAMAEAYTKGKRGIARKAAHEAFIAGAQALSVAMREEMYLRVDSIKPQPESIYDREGRDPEHRRVQIKEAMRRHRAKKKLANGHAWFTP